MKLLQNSPYEPYELYNLYQDPTEQRNLINFQIEQHYMGMKYIEDERNRQDISEGIKFAIQYLKVL